MGWEKLLFHRHLENDEELIYVVHRHWLALIGPAIKTAFFGFVLPATVAWYFPGSFWFMAAWAVSFWIYFVYALADWFFDAWLATSTSLIKIEWKGLFHHTSKRVPYAEVREMSSEVKGILGTIFRYGNASVGTSSGSRLEMSRVSHPKKIELLVTDIRNRYVVEQSLMQKDALNNLLSDLVLSHIRERGIRFRRS